MSFAAVNTPRFVLADLVPGTLVRDLALVVGGAALTGLAAQVTIFTGFTPVPFTLQTAAVLGVGAALGTVRGLLAMVLYLLVGLAGVPWFAGQSSGWSAASFGYILGFVAAAAVVGALAERRADRRVWSSVPAMAAGSVLIYAIGTSWLAVALDVSFGRALELGVLPFLVGDAVKIIAVALVLPATWALVNRRR